MSYIRELITSSFPLHALGIGHPTNIALAYRAGWSIFDSALPTRDARRGRLFSLPDRGNYNNLASTAEGFDYLYIADKKHIKDQLPMIQDCDCICCQQVSTGYLHHLFRIDENLYYRLASLHNLRYIVKLCEVLGSRENARKQ